MNFALYSSNWTQMGMKFKKLLFLSMKMHDANKLNMKLTADLVINLELFTSVRIKYFSVNKTILLSDLSQI